MLTAGCKRNEEMHVGLQRERQRELTSFKQIALQIVTQ